MDAQCSFPSRSLLALDFLPTLDYPFSPPPPLSGVRPLIIVLAKLIERGVDRGGLFWASSGVTTKRQRDQINLSDELEGNGLIDEQANVAEVSVANSNFIFEISNLNYLGTYVHVASNSLIGGL